MVDPESPLPRRTDRIALHRVESESERYGDQHGKQHTHPPPPEAALHVVSRTTDIGSAPAALIKLREGRFEEGARGPHEGNHPHPEDRTGTSDHNGRGHAREVPRTDAAGQRHGKGLERRDVPFALRAASGRLAQYAHHFAQQAELYAPRTQGKPHGTSQQRRNQHIGPQHVVHAADPIGKCLHLHLFWNKDSKVGATFGSRQGKLPLLRPADSPSRSATAKSGNFR